MDNELFREFKCNNKVDVKIIEKYKNKLPHELISEWKIYGFGSILNGYIKIINPDEYRAVTDMSYFRSNVAIPIMVTGFGDIITWEENNYIGMIDYKRGDVNIIASGFEFFFDDLKTDYYLNKYFELNKYNEAVAKWGELEYDQCFGYVPLLSLGGSEKVENLDKVKIREHIELITQLVGRIE